MTTTHEPTIDGGGGLAATTSDADADVDAFAEKVFADLLGAMSTYAATIGVRPRLVPGTRRRGSDDVDRAGRGHRQPTSATPGSGSSSRTVTGYLSVADPSAPPTERRFTIGPAATEVLTDRFEPRLHGALPADGEHGRRQHRPLDRSVPDRGRLRLAPARRRCPLRSGGSEPPVVRQPARRDYLPSIPAVDSALRSGGRVADVGCGLGWSSIGIAEAYPTASVDGYDIDGPSIEAARVNAAEAGLADRVRFHAVDVGGVDGAGYDLVLALECIHDMPDPVSVLASMRRMVAPGGTVIVMDERVGDEFTGEPDPVEQLMYGFSLLVCLADGRNAPESVATGTVMRRPDVRALRHRRRLLRCRGAPDRARLLPLLPPGDRRPPDHGPGQAGTGRAHPGRQPVRPSMSKRAPNTSASLPIGPPRATPRSARAAAAPVGSSVWSTIP